MEQSGIDGKIRGVITGKWGLIIISGIAIVGVAVIVGALLLTSSKNNKPPENVDQEQVSASAQADPFGFSAEQNDPAGYGGFQWGTSVLAFMKANPVSSKAEVDDPASSAIPPCPDGSQPQQSNVDRHYTSHQCKVPDQSNGMDMCSEWDSNAWNAAGENVPCSSRASLAFTYSGSLTCPISRQVYLSDRTTGQSSKEVTCLPAGWVEESLDGTTCPAGFVNGSPAIFGQDSCYGPNPPAPPPDIVAEFVHTGNDDDRDDSHELAKVFNVPESEHGGGMLTYQDTDYSVIPSNFQAVSKGDSDYVFYKGRLAMAYSKLDAHHEDDVVADLTNKYQQVGTSTSGWSQHTLDDGPPDTTDVDVTLFKRGMTNTRIYLIDRIDHEAGVGVKVSSLHVLYIPTSFMWEIQHDIQALADAHQAATQAAQHQAAQADTNKLE